MTPASDVGVDLALALEARMGHRAQVGGADPLRELPKRAGAEVGDRELRVQQVTHDIVVGKNK